MIKIIVSLLVVGCATSSFAQGGLGSQIDAVHAAFEQQKRDDAAAEAKRRDLLAQQEAAKKRASDAARAKEQPRRAEIASTRRVKEARDDSYEDQLRDLEIQQRKLDLKAREARVVRENEFIDQQLKHSAAQTDVVQSNADANRNLTEGAKSFLEDTGKAQVKKSSGWFK